MWLEPAAPQSQVKHPTTVLLYIVNRLNPDQAPQNARPDLDPDCIFLKEIFEKVDFEKKQQPTKKHVGKEKISNFAVFFFSKITNKAWYFMRIVCWQTILMKYHTLFLSKIWKDFTKFVICSGRDWHLKG